MQMLTAAAIAATAILPLPELMLVSPTKTEVATSALNLTMPAAENEGMQRFWTKLDTLLSATMTHPQWLEPEGNREDTRVVFIGVSLDTSAHGTALCHTLSTMYQCEVFSAIEQMRQGRDLIETYFNLDYTPSTNMLKCVRFL